MARLVCSAGQIVSSFIVPLSTVFIVGVDEVSTGLVYESKGLCYCFHIMHVVLEGRFAYLRGCGKVKYLGFESANRGLAVSGEGCAFEMVFLCGLSVS